MPGQHDSLESRMQANLEVRMQAMHQQQMMNMQQQMMDRDARISSTMNTQYSNMQLMESMVNPQAFTTYENNMMRRQFGRNLGSSAVGLAGAGLGMAATMSMPLLPGLIVGGLVGAGVDRAIVQPLRMRMQNVARTEDYLESSSYRYIRPWDSHSPFGAGFSFDEQSDVARFVRNLGPKKHMSQDNLHSMLQNFTEGELFEGVRNVKEFTDKFEKLVNSVKTSAKLLGTSFEQVSKLMGDYQRMGLNAGNFDLFAAQMRQVASFSGQSTEAVIGNVLQGARSVVTGTNINPENAINRRAYNTALLGIEYSMGKDEDFKQLMRNLPGGRESAGEVFTQAAEQLFTNQQFGAISAAFYDYDTATRKFVFRPERASQIRNLGDLNQLASTSLGRMDLTGQQLFMRRYPELAMRDFTGGQGNAAAMSMLRAVSGNNDPISAAMYLGLDPTSAQVLVGGLNSFSKYGEGANMQLSRGAFQAYVQSRLVAQTPTIGQRWNGFWEGLGNAVYGDAAQGMTDWGVKAGMAIDRMTGMPVPINQFVPTASMSLGKNNYEKIMTNMRAAFIDARGVDTELERRREETPFARFGRGFRDNQELSATKNVRAFFENWDPARNLEIGGLRIGGLQNKDFESMMKTITLKDKDAAIHYNAAVEKLSRGNLAESDRFAYQAIVDGYEGKSKYSWSQQTSPWELTEGFTSRRAQETDQYKRMLGADWNESRMSDLTGTIDSIRRQLDKDYDKFRRGGDYKDLTRSISRSDLDKQTKEQLIQAFASGDLATIERLRSNDRNVEGILAKNEKAYKTVSEFIGRQGSVDKLIGGSGELKEYGLFAGYGYKSIFEYLAGEDVSGADKALKEATSLYQDIGSGKLPLDLGEKLKAMEAKVRSSVDNLPLQHFDQPLIRKFITASPEWDKRIYRYDSQGKAIGVNKDQYADFLLQMMTSPSDAAASDGDLSAGLDKHLTEFKKLTDTITGEISNMKEVIAHLRK